MSDSFHYDAFLSHSAKDKAVVRAIAGRLRADELRVWFDEWVIRPGDSIPASSPSDLAQSAGAKCRDEVSGPLGK